MATRADVPGRERLGHLVALGLGALGGIAPVLAYQTLHLGGPFRTGYDVWPPSRWRGAATPWHSTSR